MSRPAEAPSGQYNAQTPGPEPGFLKVDTHT